MELENEVMKASEEADVEPQDRRWRSKRTEGLTELGEKPCVWRFWNVAERPIPSLEVVQRPSKTQGNCWFQEPSTQRALREFFM